MTDDVLASAAERFGTPVYVYDLDAVRAAVAELRAALPRASLRFAVKANANGDVLRALAGAGVGAEVITVGELERSLRAGMPPSTLVLGGPRQDAELVARAAAAGVALASLDGPGQWATWEAELDARPAVETRFLVRVNPGLDPRTHEHLATGAASSKFGLAPPRAASLAELVAGRGRLAGFHVHAGSMIRDLSMYDEVAAVLEPLGRAFPGCDTLDLGGGFAVPGFPLAGFAARADALAGRLGHELVVEPGRFLVAAAGTLVTRVLHVKPGDPPHVVADAGMAELLRPALYGAEHPIRRVLRHGEQPRPAAAAAADASIPAITPAAGTLPAVDVDGPLCENADRLGRHRALPGVAPGDLLAVEQAGAYGFSMASNYASSLRPAEVVAERAGPSVPASAEVTLRLSRRRERPEDLWRLEDESA